MRNLVNQSKNFRGSKIPHYAEEISNFSILEKLVKTDEKLIWTRNPTKVTRFDAQDSPPRFVRFMIKRWMEFTL